MTVLHFDCFSGAAGDMIVGALIDAGVPLDDLRHALGSLAVDPDAIWTERVTRAGISATKFHVRGEDREYVQPRASGDSDHHTHGHDHHLHDHPHHEHQRTEDRPLHDGHRTLAAIERLIDGSALSGAGKDRAKALFARLAEAEAAIHGTPVERVHLHEVGALDSIVDVVGAVYALDALGVARVTASPLNVGGGTVQSAHGAYPVPAPATARLLRSAPIYSGPQQVELVTPTGALLVTGYAESYGPVPAMRLDREGYGAGSRDVPGTPNVLRVLIGEATAAAASEDVVVIETEIDDMNPQIFGVLMDRLLATGALDVFYTAIQMKKGRPGTLLSIIAPPHLRERLTALVFQESTSIGVRHTEMRRECLDRETVVVNTPFGPVGVKLARRGGALLNASPEFDDCARVAAEIGRPVKEVQAAALKAYLDGPPADRP